MEKIEETNLPLPEEQAEAQTSDELNAEELEAVAGGNAIVEGARDMLQGFTDRGEEDNLNHLVGDAIGDTLDKWPGIKLK